MRKLLLPALGFVVLGVVLLSLSAPAGAAPFFQLTPFPTPTPGADGRILYTVQQGDTCFRIAAVAGITLDELRLLNNLDPECVVIPGQVLILAILTAPTPTGGAEVTPLPSGPTPTSGPGTGVLCIVLFNDVNGDALRQESEPSIPGGAVSVSETSGLFADSGVTADGFDVDDPALAKSVCFEGMPAGTYNVSVAIPEGYNPTTGLDATESLEAGGETMVNFGAQVSTEGERQNPAPQEGGRSPLLGVAGFTLVAGGVLLWVISRQMRRTGPSKPFKRG